MLIDTKMPHIILKPETETEGHQLIGIPWVLRKDNVRYCYWTHVVSLMRRFQLRLSSKAKADILKQRSIDRTLKNVKPLSSQGEALVVRWFANDYKPRPYQVIGMVQIMRERRVLLADDTGLGKTVQSLGASVIAAYNEVSGDIGSIVVICAAGLRHQWRSEALRMFIDPKTALPYLTDDDILLIDGPPALRQALLRQEPRALTIVNYELLIRDGDAIMKHLSRRGIYSLIIDESSRIKNSANRSYQVIRRLVDQFKPKMVIGLNATPIENTLSDMWAQFSVIYPTIFPDYHYFEERYVKKIMIRLPNGMRMPKITGHRNVEEAKYLIRDRYIRRTYNDVDEQLPEAVVSMVRVSLKPEQREAYDIAQNDTYSNDDQRVTTLFQRALFCKTSSGKIVSAKLDALVDLLADIGDKVVIVTESKIFAKAMVEEIKKIGKVAVIHGDVSDPERNRIVNEFTNGSLMYLVGTSAIERGLNLQRAGFLINMDLPWNPAKFTQRVGRLRRLNSRHACVRVINIIADDTVDERVIEVVYKKNRLFTSVFDGERMEFSESATLKEIATKS